MRKITIALAVVTLILVIPVGVGYLLPATHEASVSEVHPATPERLWALLTDVESFPEWRSGIERVEVDERDPSGLPTAWTEHSSFGPMPLRVLDSRPHELLVARIDSDELGFGGTWTYRLEAAGEARARLTITENGTIPNPLFRMLARWVLGYDRTMRAYQDDLGAALGG